MERNDIKGIKNRNCKKGGNDFCFLRFKILFAKIDITFS